MAITQDIPSLVHAGNPVRMSFKLNNKTDTLSVSIFLANDAVIHTFRYFPDNNLNVSFDISEILQPYVSSSDVYSDDIIYPVGGIIDSAVLVITHYSGIISFPYFRNFKFLFGGVSNKALRIFASNNQDIFSYRLTNYTNQFFFTTRTNSRTISLRESELYPFYFIVPSGNIQIRTQDGKALNVTHSLPAGTIAAINLKTALKEIKSKYGVTVSRLNLFVNNNYAFNVAILPSAKSIHKQILRFRNSIGGYEQIEVTGRAENNPEFEEEQLYGVYDTITNNFVDTRFRRPYRDVMNASAGWKSPDELNFILELLSSDDVYLIEDEGWKTKVHVSKEEFIKKINPSDPQSVKLIIRAAEMESFFSPADYVNEENGWFQNGTLMSMGRILINSKIHTI